MTTVQMYAGKGNNAPPTPQTAKNRAKTSLTPDNRPISPPPNFSEIWKPFPDFEGRYELSSFGQICSVHTGILITTSIDTDGYEYLHVKQGGRKKAIVVRVDWAVATAFLPNPQDLSLLIHLDGDKLNSQVSNLMWAPAQVDSDLYTSNLISHD